MTQLILAAEGGYQEFTLTSTEWMWLWIAAATAVLALIVGWGLARGVLSADPCTGPPCQMCDTARG